MRDSARIDPMIEELRRVWKQNPSLRLGQLMSACAHAIDSEEPIFYVEDGKMMLGIKELGKPHRPDCGCNACRFTEPEKEAL